MPRTKKNKGPNFDNLANQSDARLMCLPAELRNGIYELSLPDWMKFPRRSQWNRKGYAKMPGLLMACKQTYLEAKSIYYATTTMLFTANYRLSQWAGKLKQEDKKALKKVIFQCRVFTNAHGMRIVNPLRSSTGPGRKPQRQSWYTDLVFEG